MRLKKVRGIKRKTDQMVNRIEENTQEFPTEFYNGYWHLHLTVGQGFISSYKTPLRIKRLCIQTLLDRAEYLKGLQPNDEEKYRVVAAIEFPTLGNSQIIIFKGDVHFKDFFNRNDNHQKWILLSAGRNLQTEWEVSVPDDSAIGGFKEIINDEDGCYESEIWFVGELK